MLVSAFLLYLLFQNTHAQPFPETTRNVPEIIAYYGYPVEVHNVTTRDGYILAVHRIPCGVSSRCVAGVKRPVIFLQHGLLASSADWVLNGQYDSAGFIFADAGYDVWMGNMRGNRYSRRHTKLSVDSNKFWEFSFDQHAAYDLPAMLNFALEKTGQEYLYYLGHSQGTLTAFIQFSVDPELASRVRLFLGFAPVVSTKRMKGLFRTISDITNGAKDVADAIFNFVTNAAEEVITAVKIFFTGNKERVEIEFNLFKDVFYTMLSKKEFLPSQQGSQDFMKWLCTLNILFKLNCQNMFLLVSGENTNQSNIIRQEAFLAHYPAGTSSRNVLHWLQFVKRGWTPRKFDFESEQLNRNAYGQAAPPEYNLTNFRTDRRMWVSFDDHLARPADLHDIFFPRRGVRMYVKTLDGTNHLDFLYGTRAKDLYKEVIEEISKNEKVKYVRECYAKKEKATSAECSKVLPPADEKPFFEVHTNVRAGWIWPTTQRPKVRAGWIWPTKPSR